MFPQSILLELVYKHVSTKLNYPTPNQDHLVRELESTKRVTRRDTPSVYKALMEDVNALEPKIIKLNGNIVSIKRKHNPNRKSLSKTSTLRCSKCEGYGHETHQCPNGYASSGGTWRKYLGVPN